MFDILTEFNNQRDCRDQDTNEHWIKLENIQTRSRSLGVEIGSPMAVNKFLSSLPAEYTTVLDNLRVVPVLLPDQTRGQIKDEYISLVKAGGAKGTDHSRAFSTGGKSTVAKGNFRAKQ